MWSLVQLHPPAGDMIFFSLEQVRYIGSLHLEDVYVLVFIACTSTQQLGWSAGMPPLSPENYSELNAVRSLEAILDQNLLLV